MRPADRPFAALTEMGQKLPFEVLGVRTIAQDDAPFARRVFAAGLHWRARPSPV